MMRSFSFYTKPIKLHILIQPKYYECRQPRQERRKMNIYTKNKTRKEVSLRVRSILRQIDAEREVGRKVRLIMNKKEGANDVFMCRS